MDGILKELYYGNLELNIRLMDSKGNYIEPFKTYDERETKLINSFTDEQCDLYEEYCETEAEVESEVAIRNFIHGFKCGAKIIAEVFADSE